jgi:hypothetical protein
MAVSDPNQQQSWTPPTPPPGYSTVPADAQPTTSGDRWALIALAVSLTVLLSCVPGLNCLAFLAPLVVGIIALVQAKNAVDPSRARMYGWIATGVGILILLVFVGIVVAYGALIINLMNDPSFRNLPR